MQTFVSSTLGVKQVGEVFALSGEDSETATACLLSGPTLPALLKMLNNRFDDLRRKRVRVDINEIWNDMVACYKRTSFNYSSHLQVTLDGQPAVDTGGVRRQLYTTVFHDFASNKHVKLFDGPDHHLRPTCSAEARSSGLPRWDGCTQYLPGWCRFSLSIAHMLLVCHWGRGESSSVCVC